jgi:hypothetical protein
MVRGAHVESGVRKVEQFAPQCTGKDMIMVRENDLRQTVQFVYFVDEKLSHL